MPTTEAASPWKQASPRPSNTCAPHWPNKASGLLTEIDVAATMKAKPDMDMPAHLILGACNPPLAHQGLTIAPSIGLLLACNVVVRTLVDGRTLVEAMNPDVMVAATGDLKLGRAWTGSTRSDDGRGEGRDRD